ncbi:MAG: hypothetical protein QXD62_01850 [Candidatus Woesearchaeota archaeon]
MNTINKKGVSLWVSWVLLILLLVVGASIVGGWMISSTKESVKNMKERVDGELCAYLWIRTEKYCQEQSVVKLLLSNPSSRTVDGFKIITYDIYGNVYTKLIEDKLPRSTYQREFKVLKDNVIFSLEVIPFYLEKSGDDVYRVYCNSRKIVYEKVPFCDEK